VKVRAALAGGFSFSVFFFRRKRRANKVFNTRVENSVEKHDSIFVSDSARDGSAFCTASGAGTFVVRTQTRSLPVRNFVLGQT
jgi:hypothetical protein